MEVIKVEISWEDKNYCCGWACEGFGAVLCTNKELSQLKNEFEAAIRSQVADMQYAGEDLPQWLSAGDYIIEFTLAASALLRQAEQFTSMAAISRITGINQKLLSHYANSIKVPREAQRQRIIEGLHRIGKEILAVH